MACDLLTPVTWSAPVDLAAGLVYRKQILPVTKVHYKGRVLDFNEDYLRNLVDAYNDAAYDSVPFTLATEDNRHTDDPERIRGEVTSVSLSNPGEAPGLYATIAFPNAEAAQSVMFNPKLGVSCRILEGVAKSDGRQYPMALKHVCGTPDPHVTGMSPWRKVDLSGYDEHDELVDLSTGTYAPEAPVAPNQVLDNIDYAALSDEELQILAKALHISDEDIASYLADDEADADDDADEDEDQDSDEAPADEAAPPVTQQAPAAQRATNLTAAVDIAGSADDGNEVPVDLTARQLATAARQRADEALTAMAQTAWDQRKSTLIGSGVPPFLVELCAPIFNRPHGLTIDLTEGDNEDTLDVQAVVGQLLDGMRGYVDLANETGHGGQFRAQASEADPDEALLNQWATEHGR